MKRTIALAGLMALLIVPVSGYGDTRNDDPGQDTAVSKLGRGLAAMTTGFLELPGNIVAETRERSPGAGMTIGFAKGLGMIPVRELVGVYETVTSPFAVPSGYEPIIRPVYPWDYFQGAGSARPGPGLS